ncbi:FadR/GntR family transcriptional regulator [Kitasatospora viridis]|uniref:GntR family transcriptional regulator n=1 Tax=Kitasatospora viridis TaxID=281105 RepID=A0A561TVH1_9ACTN|nr:FadR/GntR family transcriptional regulator [Kitasatospora viridis]TWF91107.1 GntR family transcriptional regulator [Kitasatospora viridis]
MAEVTPGAASAYRPGYETAAERILELIAAEGLAPGDRLPTEYELAERIGTSRTVVREAVKMLSALGRVRALKGRGLFVADDPGMLGTTASPFFLPTDLEHVYMLFEFRRAQEMESSRLAATRATPAELRAIGEAVDLCGHGFETGDVATFIRGDDAFHMSVAAASHNFFTVAVIREARRLQSQSSLIGMSGELGPHAPQAVEEHAAIYRAIRAGDPEAAAQAAAVHIENSLEDYRKEIQRRLFQPGGTSPA